MRRVQFLSVVGLCVLASACGKGPSAPAGGAAEINAEPSASAPEVGSATAMASLPAPYNTGDVDNGHAKFALCQACHTIIAGAPNMTGPNLHGVIGRKSGSVATYSYSDAMKGAGWTWDAQHLDAWLAGPQKLLPGTKMTFVGLSNPQDRIDVIAYLASASGS